MNGKVLVPQYGIPEDIQTLQTYQDAMPSYDVIGFNHDIGNPWYSEDALHCRTMGVFNPDMIHISHKSIRTEEIINNGSIYIETEVVDYSDFDTMLDVIVHWKYSAEDGPFGEFALEFELDNIYSGTFPSINLNSEIEYFITATNISGNSVSHPNSGWHIFNSADSILGDVNSDNVINILDIILVVNIILGINDFNNLADINIDGSIDILDVVQLVNVILNN